MKGGSGSDNRKKYKGLNEGTYIYEKGGLWRELRKAALLFLWKKDLSIRSSTSFGTDANTVYNRRKRQRRMRF